MKIENLKKKKKIGFLWIILSGHLLGGSVGKKCLEKGGQKKTKEKKKEKKKERPSCLNKTNELYRRENLTNNMQLKKKKKKLDTLRINFV